MYDIFFQPVKSIIPIKETAEKALKRLSIFNLRDFARVIRGVLLCPPKVFKDEKKLYRLWVHEIYRVFYDRLIDDDDRLL